MKVTHWARFGNGQWFPVPAEKVEQFKRVVPEAEVKVRVHSNRRLG